MLISVLLVRYEIVYICNMIDLGVSYFLYCYGFIEYFLFLEILILLFFLII